MRKKFDNSIGSAIIDLYNSIRIKEAYQNIPTDFLPLDVQQQYLDACALIDRYKKTQENAKIESRLDPNKDYVECVLCECGLKNDGEITRHVGGDN